MSAERPQIKGVRLPYQELMDFFEIFDVTKANAKALIGEVNVEEDAEYRRGQIVVQTAEITTSGYVIGDREMVISGRGAKVSIRGIDLAVEIFPEDEEGNSEGVKECYILYGELKFFKGRKNVDASVAVISFKDDRRKGYALSVGNDNLGLDVNLHQQVLHELLG